jgi:hypothetical protein
LAVKSGAIFPTNTLIWFSYISKWMDRQVGREYSAAMKFRKPQLIPLIFIVVATLLLSGLGAWQLQRLSWKLEQLRLVDAAQNEPHRHIPIR